MCYYTIIHCYDTTAVSETPLLRISSCLVMWIIYGIIILIVSPIISFL